MNIKHRNGSLFSEGDSVHVMKDVKAKGLCLKQCFVKKACP